MFEMTYGELFLFLWSVVATGFAWKMYERANSRGRMLMGASVFIKKVVEDDGLRDELRAVIAKDREANFKFGAGE